MNITDESITTDDAVHRNLLGKSIYKISQYFRLTKIDRKK
jgi:hypothetical protein